MFAHNRGGERGGGTNSPKGEHSHFLCDTASTRQRGMNVVKITEKLKNTGYSEIDMSKTVIW